MPHKDYRKARRHVDVSVGESVRIMRELQELSQNGLAEQTGIPQSTLSAIENDRVNLGVERAKVLARALRCHPAVLVFPGWIVGDESEQQGLGTTTIKGTVDASLRLAVRQRQLQALADALGTIAERLRRQRRKRPAHAAR